MKSIYTRIFTLFRMMRERLSDKTPRKSHIPQKRSTERAKFKKRWGTCATKNWTRKEMDCKRKRSKVAKGLRSAGKMVNGTPRKERKRIPPVIGRITRFPRKKSEENEKP
jgi:hypothetical protein